MKRDFIFWSSFQVILKKNDERSISMRVLLVEDDRHLCQSLKLSLMDEGYAVDVVYDGEEGLELALMTHYDVIILDILLPSKDGYTVCRQLRQKRVTTPILMFTARDTIDDRVTGLDNGADDYLVKPFALRELLARIRALLRRNSSSKSGIITLGNLTLDPATHDVRRGDVPIKLNVKEFALLEYFVRHPHQILTRQMIENHIWSYDFINASNVVDVYIRRLRRKIDDPFQGNLIETVYGAGYRLRPPVEEGIQ
jgi:two-component system, OmpR family, copper resistance phosphate regulon response regulator CusR